jgi:hypothetical protein
VKKASDILVARWKNIDCFFLKQPRNQIDVTTNVLFVLDFIECIINGIFHIFENIIDIHVFIGTFTITAARYKGELFLLAEFIGEACTGGVLASLELQARDRALWARDGSAGPHFKLHASAFCATWI